MVNPPPSFPRRRESTDSPVILDLIQNLHNNGDFAPPLWIDESSMNLFEILGFQPE